jgi:hypothetical protein
MDNARDDNDSFFRYHRSNNPQAAPVHAVFIMTDEIAVTTAAALRRTNSHRRQRGSSLSIITTTTTPAAGRCNSSSKPAFLAKMHQCMTMMTTLPCQQSHVMLSRTSTTTLVLTTAILMLMYIVVVAPVFWPTIIEEEPLLYDNLPWRSDNVAGDGGGGVGTAAKNRPEEEKENNIRFLTHNYGWATLRLKLMTNNEEKEEDHNKNTVRTGPWHSAEVFVHFAASDDTGGTNNNNNKKPISSSCRPSSFALRLISEDAALVGILLQEEEYPPSLLQPHRDDSSRTGAVVWRGNFTIPLPGTYTVEFRWSNDDDSCGDDNGATTTGTSTGTGGAMLLSPLSPSTTGTALSFIAVGLPATVPQQPDNDDDTASSLFANGVWMSQKLLPNSYNNNNNDLGSNSRRGSDYYIWADPLTAPLLDQDHAAEEYIYLKDVGTAVAKHGTFRFPDEMYRFDELGNYELVCFWGGTIMHRIRTIFLHEKNILSKGQRPFKFHYYNITTRFQPQPDVDWSTEDKERCRKCKHIFLSIDDIIINRNDDNSDTLSSQVEFEAQLVKFILHLQQLMNDPTFPIWILTTTVPTNGPTTSSRHRNNNRACHEQRKYPHTTDHPCNDVLKALFRPNQQGQLSSSRLLFQPRVHLMDNTDLTLPFRLYDDDNDDNNSMQDLLLANIALRIFVAVGKGVADWRQNGQQGLIDGLHRNGTVEPNFVLVPYDWSSVVSPPP